MNKYQLVSEALNSSSFYANNSSDILYHASSIQNLKEISAKGTTQNKKIGLGIYATNDKTYASAFSFAWKDSDRISVGQTNNGPWIMHIPLSFKPILAKKVCSIYTVSIKNFHDMSTQVRTPEWFSSHYDVPVLGEEKYRSVLDCFKQNNLQVKWITG